MADYTTTITDAGIAKLQAIANAAGTLQWTAIRCGDGQVGAGDAQALTGIISEKQSFGVVDVRLGEDGTPYIYFTCTNDGLAVGYTRWEIGVYGRAVGDVADTLIIYLYAETEPKADYIPAEAGGASVQTFRVQVAASQDLSATVAIDQSTVFLNLSRWAEHLAGGGGVDQHPVATSDASGFESAADKAKLDIHIPAGAPSSGATIHALATQALSGFMSAPDKRKLDGIEAGAQVNQNAFGIVKVGATNVVADADGDTLELEGSTYIALTPDAAGDKVTIAAQNITPSSHIGSGGAQHAEATTVVSGFLSPIDKAYMNGHWGQGGGTHPAATSTVNGFFTSTEKIKLAGLDDAAYVKLTGDQSVAGTKSFNDPIRALDTNSPIFGAKFLITPTGGYAIKLKNRTGAASVHGSAVMLSTVNDDSVVLTEGYTSVGIGYLYGSGVANGDDVWVVIVGIAEAILEPNFTVTRGALLDFSSGTSGRLRPFTNYDGMQPCRAVAMQYASSSPATQIIRVLAMWAPN